MYIFSFLIPLALTIIEGYIKSSSSKNDDIILDLVKTSVAYLEPKDNNDISHVAKNIILNTKIKG